MADLQEANADIT